MSYKASSTVSEFQFNLSTRIWTKKLFASVFCQIFSSPNKISGFFTFAIYSSNSFFYASIASFLIHSSSSFCFFLASNSSSIFFFSSSVGSLGGSGETSSETESSLKNPPKLMFDSCFCIGSTFASSFTTGAAIWYFFLCSDSISLISLSYYSWNILHRVISLSFHFSHHSNISSRVMIFSSFSSSPSSPPILGGSKAPAGIGDSHI